LDALQARILEFKLPHLDRWNADRRRIARAYQQGLAGLPLQWQYAGDASEPIGADHVYHLFQIQTPQRDDLMVHLKRQAIDATVRYPTPIHLQPAFKALNYREGDFPVSERLARELLCLPLRPGMTDLEIERVCDSVKGFFKQAL
jgi:dTDP-4-amino-4,6-dideoxygalactose transaminase